jgi:hypothetical protein
MSRPSRRGGRADAAAVLLVCVAAVALLSPGSASAFSRGFVIKNDSDKTLVFEDFSTTLPPKESIEDRPALGSPLRPGGSQRFELTWYFFSRNEVGVYYRVVGVKEPASFRIRLIVDGAHTECPTGRFAPPNYLRCESGRNATISNWIRSYRPRVSRPDAL